MPTDDEAADAVHPDVGTPTPEDGQPPDGEPGLFDLYASHAYQNPDFFHPKEIASLTMSMSVQILPLIIRRGRVTVKDIKRAQHLAAMLISLSIDDRSMQQLFQRATTVVDPQNDVLLQARRRLAEAIGSGVGADEGDI